MGVGGLSGKASQWRGPPSGCQVGERVADLRDKGATEVSPHVVHLASMLLWLQSERSVRVSKWMNEVQKVRYHLLAPFT